MTIENSLEAGDVIASRYMVERLVGSGGAAEVYAVRDISNDQRLALKRLSVSSANGAVAEIMLAREYDTLADLSHPLIIRAFDYGKDAGVPYYTMELLSGVTLRELAPLGWRDTCHVIRDVASALGLIHSRRLVHRDVTTRNVCRVDGRAKLIDFGALTPMGPVRDLVGTPPFVPPEALDEQRLDGRADLYALGAVAYFLLTGEHAYPARTFSELGSTWRFAANPPSARAKDVPPALDELVLSLLSLPRNARPRSAAEVYQRLSAIAELPSLDGPDVAQAYLVTPVLVGRERALTRVRRYLDRLERGKGSALLFEGESGVGRTRLLGAFLLEAKLRGYVTLRASGRDLASHPFHLVHELAGALPGNAPEAATSENATRLSELFLEGAAVTPVVVAVDDIDLADDQSVTALALLSQRARSAPLALVFTAQPRARGPAMSELRRSAMGLAIEPFTPDETRALVSSLFGEVSHVDALAEWVHRLTDGRPRASLELAQHLVDSGVATYKDGSWVLPASLEGLGLPETIDQALEARLVALSAEARELLQLLSLMTEHDPLLVTEYRALYGGKLPATTFGALNELSSASLIVGLGEAYVLAHHELIQIARRSIPERALPGLHLRLASAYASGSASDTVLVVYHLFRAGDRLAAFEAAVRAVTHRIDQNARGSGLARSRDGSAITETLFVWGIENAMPRRALVLLGRSLLQLASVVNGELARHADLVLEPLRRESGLAYWDEFPDVTDLGLRMQMCLGHAFAAYESTPEGERGLTPRDAIAELATSAGMLIGVYAREFDGKGSAEMIRLLEPLRTLSPAVDVVADIVAVADKAVVGYGVLEGRERIYERLSSPISGLDDLSRQGILYVALYYLGLDEANYGRESALVRVAPLDAHPHLAPLAWQVRMLFHLFRGDVEKAACARRKRDAASTGRMDIDRHLDLSVIYEAGTAHLLGDLLALERNLGVIAERAQTIPGWRPYEHAFRGHYHALRGELTKALEHHRRAADLVPMPGVHAAWGLCQNGLATTLIDLDRAAEAAALVEDALSNARGVPVFPYVRAQLEMNLALARACLGEAAEATRLAEAAIESMNACGIDGAIVLDHHVKRALIALRLRDTPAFERASATVETLALSSGSEPFAAKHEFLLRQARNAASFRPAVSPHMEIVTRRESHTTMVLGLRTELEKCRTRSERTVRVLDVLLEWSGTESGFLYLFDQTGLTLAASHHGREPPESVEDRVDEWLRAFRDGDVVTWSPFGAEQSTTADSYDTVGLVAHRDDGALLAGVAALGRSEPRRPVPENVLGALAETLLSYGDSLGRALGE
ncbi:MAG TPA: AAA family ATPase [Polyangiaceae bacterium]|nr:AAA family ATPase [Polyangiaceae bacterium]